MAAYLHSHGQELLLKMTTKCRVAALLVLLFSCVQAQSAEVRGLILYRNPPSTWVDCYEFYSIARGNPMYFSINGPQKNSTQMFVSGLLATVDFPIGADQDPAEGKKKIAEIS